MYFGCLKYRLSIGVVPDFVNVKESHMVYELNRIHSVLALWRLQVFEHGTYRVPTSFGNHGKPGKSLKKVPCMEKSWNLKKNVKIMEFCEII